MISRSDLQTWTPTFELWWPWIFLIPFDGTKNLNVWRDRKRFACIDFFFKIFFYSQLFHFRFHSVHRKKSHTRFAHKKLYKLHSREEKKILSSTLRSESERNYRNLVNYLFFMLSLNTISIEFINEIFVIFIFSTLSRHTKKRFFLFLIEARTRNHWRSTRLDVSNTSERNI